MDFSQILNSTIAPIALISGVGLILLSLTNRLGRAIDRAREIINELSKNPDKELRKNWENQLLIIHKRAKYLKYSMTGIVSSILLTSLLILFIIVSNLFGKSSGIIADVILISSAFAIFVSIVFFLLEVRLALSALEMRIQETIGKEILD